MSKKRYRHLQWNDDFVDESFKISEEQAFCLYHFLLSFDTSHALNELVLREKYQKESDKKW